MSQQVSPSSGRAYRLARVWAVARATIHRQRRPTVPRSCRPGPNGPMPNAALVEALQAVLAGRGLHGEGCRQVRARPRFAGIRTSRRRVLRLMREHGLLAHQRPGAPRGPRSHDGTSTTERVDVMGGADLTTVLTGEGQAAVLVAVDPCSTERVGIHASRGATRLEALEPIRQGVRQRLGGFDRQIAAGLAVRHDRGSQHVAHDFQKELAFLGIESSPSFVRAPEGNGGAEARPPYAACGHGAASPSGP